MPQSIHKYLLPSLFLIGICFVNSCTKHAAKVNNSSSSSGSNTSGSNSSQQGGTPLGGGSGSSSGGSGSSSGGSGSSSGGSGSSSGGSGSSSGGSGSSSGGSGSSSGGSGSSSGGSTAPAETYVQALDYKFSTTNTIWTDSMQLLDRGYYTTLTAGTKNFYAKWNSFSYKLGPKFLNPYTFYSLVFFEGHNLVADATLLHNGTATPNTNRAFVRIINLDPDSKTSPLSITMQSYMDTIIQNNRGYLDHTTDTGYAIFKDVYATTADVIIKRNNVVIKSASIPFTQGKKYSLFVLSDYASGNLKLYVGQHN